MQLYLRSELVKARTSEAQTGEQRGGSYAARVQVGYEKDNSPKYRYFKTQDEYKTYLEGSKKKDDKSSKKKDPKGKTNSERKDSKKDSKEDDDDSSKQSLLKKGLDLYIAV